MGKGPRDEGLIRPAMDLAVETKRSDFACLDWFTSEILRFAQDDNAWERYTTGRYTTGGIDLGEAAGRGSWERQLGEAAGRGSWERHRPGGGIYVGEV
jgi:hypothetical protein